MLGAWAGGGEEPLWVGERPPGAEPQGLTLTLDSAASQTPSVGDILESNSQMPLQAPALTGREALARTGCLILICLSLGWRGVTGVSWEHPWRVSRYFCCATRTSDFTSLSLDLLTSKMGAALISLRMEQASARECARRLLSDMLQTPEKHQSNVDLLVRGGRQWRRP